MNIDTLREFLGWCSVINIGIIFYWFLMISFAHDLVYRWHSKWFQLSTETFDTIHYAGITFLKLIVFVFNIVPYLVLVIIQS